MSVKLSNFLSKNFNSLQYAQRFKKKSFSSQNHKNHQPQQKSRLQKNWFNMCNLNFGLKILHKLYSTSDDILINRLIFVFKIHKTKKKCIFIAKMYFK